VTDTLLAEHWHHLPEDEVVELPETDPTGGLDTFVVERRAETFGPNAVTVRRGPGAVRRLLFQFHFGLFEYELALGSSEAVARTVAVAVFVVVLGFYLLNARSLTYSIFEIGVFSNPMIWLGIGTMAILQALYTYLPVMNSLFDSAPIDAAQWGRVFLVGFAAFLIIGLQKWVRQRMSPSPDLG
jgi:hypothetical protein